MEVESSWVALVRLWAALGWFLGGSWATWAALGGPGLSRDGPVENGPEAFLDCLERSWGGPGMVWGRFLGFVGAILGHLGQAWGLQISLSVRLGRPSSGAESAHFPLAVDKTLRGAQT